MPGGSSVEGATRRTRAPSAASRIMFERATRECRMSPQIATTRPSIRPLLRRIVSASSSAWVGCSCGAVAGIDDGAIDLLGEKMHGAGRVMAHDDDVRPHGVEGRRRVDQRLALLHRGRRDRHVHHVRAEPLAGDLEGGLRARRGLEEEVDLRAAAQGRLLLLDLAADLDLLVGQIEQRLDIQRRQPLDPEQVAVGIGSARHGRRALRLCGGKSRGASSPLPACGERAAGPRVYPRSVLWCASREHPACEGGKPAQQARVRGR